MLCAGLANLLVKEAMVDFSKDWIHFIWVRSQSVAVLSPGFAIIW